MMNICILALVLVAALGAEAANTNITLPISYILSDQYSLQANQKLSLVAHTDCSHSIGKKLEFCSELPRNWRWEPTYGYLSAQIYNNSNMTGAPLCSTGDVTTGKVPDKCCTINSWPGGNMYAMVLSNNFNPVVFTSSIKLMSSTPSFTSTSVRDPSPVYQPRGEIKTASTDTPVPMTVVAQLAIPEMVSFRDSQTIIVDVCLNAQTRQTLLATFVSSTDGAFTHYICTSYPCLPDGGNVIGFQNTPLQVGTAIADLKTTTHILERVYVAVNALSGVLNTTTNKYDAHYKFGAYFYDA